MDFLGLVLLRETWTGAFCFPCDFVVWEFLGGKLKKVLKEDGRDKPDSNCHRSRRIFCFLSVFLVRKIGAEKRKTVGPCFWQGPPANLIHLFLFRQKEKKFFFLFFCVRTCRGKDLVRHFFEVVSFSILCKTQ